MSWYDCPSCPDRFDTWDELVRHIQLKHFDKEVIGEYAPTAS